MTRDVIICGSFVLESEGGTYQEIDTCRVIVIEYLVPVMNEIIQLCE